MEELFEIRRKWGGVYLTVFEDGLVVPWRPLSLGEYISYTRDYNRGLIPNAVIEDEIFKKCVVDPVFISQMPYLKAGIVSVVVMNIWQYSGPVGIQEFNKDLHTARDIMFGDGNRALQELVQIISMAFPYKPEEIYNMDYETFMLRLVQSEKKLLDLGIIKEPVEMKDLNAPPPHPRHAIVQPDKPKVDAKKLWEIQEGLRPVSEITPPVNPHKAPDPIRPVPMEEKGKWWNVSPVLEAKKRKKIDFKTEGEAADDTMLDSHERIEPKEVKEFIRKKKLRSERDKMIQDAEWIYADLLKQIRKK